MDWIVGMDWENIIVLLIFVGISLLFYVILPYIQSRKRKKHNEGADKLWSIGDKKERRC